MNLKEIIKNMDVFRNGERLKKIAILLLLVLILAAAFVIKGGGTDDRLIDSDAPEIVAESGEDNETQSNDKAGEQSSTGTIFVDIGGAVQEPKLAELPDGSRVEDAIIEAGGLTADADLSGINRAEFLQDGMKIYIPEQSDNSQMDGNAGSVSGTDGSSSGTGGVSSGTGGVSSGTGTGGKININTADATELQQLNGVGPATAQKIIDYRNSNGRFQSIEDLKNVSGIGDKTFEKLKDHIGI